MAVSDVGRSTPTHFQFQIPKFLIVATHPGGGTSYDVSIVSDF